jgi:hypothetical protein
MEARERRHRAVTVLRLARQEMAAVAAGWEASNAVDTSPLVSPLLRIQEAIAELEQAAREEAKLKGERPRRKKRS